MADLTQYIETADYTGGSRHGGSFLGGGLGPTSPAMAILIALVVVLLAVVCYRMCYCKQSYPHTSRNGNVLLRTGYAQ